ncbi:predicted protein [Sclerotinia sclerotiorum 1980 UF-70]|uniref:Uncharacterized protein n=2 Tax=Sclerotinia sclerotiorum (strain ATCC 18683 / 1980 / Ss-1) TaxID=665079 RepID=A7EC90_SCLS1|nr:predicted protein [Sclerotinia sclerotiorum 1980 UF-70]APA09054.1 hypothetical protein sscle_04g038240 [Sclerotinia sclerotiorum 1980 UF-70]EDO00069.1 predicted protein [Sclerotinia sclerotiorum 1980 UF-70]
MPYEHCVPPPSPNPSTVTSNLNLRGNHDRPKSSITNNPPIFQPFNSTLWLLDTEQQSTQHTHYQKLLSRIFHAPDSWWVEFLQICNLTLQPKFSCSKTSVWNFYTTSQIISMRSEYLTGGRMFDDTSERYVIGWFFVLGS